jgi:type IV pilus assembly protein PilX
MIPKHGLSKSQSGVVLLISLIILVLLTLIGITGMQTTGLEEKMSGSMRDKNLAFQAAESALRDAEAYINTIKDDPTLMTLKNSTSTSCTAGLCPLATPTSTAIYATFSDDSWKSYGKQVATTITGLSEQPRYMIEILTTAPSMDTSKMYAMLRVTARAWGVNSDTVIQLQTKYTILTQSGI